MSWAAGDIMNSPRPDPASSGPGHPQGFTLFLHWAGVCWRPQTRSCLITTPQRCAPDAQSFLLHLPLWKSAQSCLPSFIRAATFLPATEPRTWKRDSTFAGGVGACCWPELPVEVFEETGIAGNIDLLDDLSEGFLRVPESCHPFGSLLLVARLEPG